MVRIIPSIRQSTSKPKHKRAKRIYSSSILIGMLIVMAILSQTLYSFTSLSPEFANAQGIGEGGGIGGSSLSPFSSSLPFASPNNSSTNTSTTTTTTTLTSRFDNQGVYTIQFPSDWTISTTLAPISSQQQQQQQGTTVPSQSPFGGGGSSTSNIFGGGGSNNNPLLTAPPSTTTIVPSSYTFNPPPIVKLNTTLSFLEVTVSTSSTSINSQQFQTQAQYFPYIIQSLYPGIIILKTEYGKYKVDGRNAASYPFTLPISSVVPNTQGLNINLTGFAVVAPMADGNTNRFMTIVYVTLPNAYEQSLPEVNQIISSIRIGSSGTTTSSIAGNTAFGGGGGGSSSNTGIPPTATSSGTFGQSWKSFYDQGVTLAGQGNYTGAVEAFDKALQLNSTNVDIWFDRGLALEQLGRYQEAIQSYDKGLQIDPNNTGLMQEKQLAQSRMNNADNMEQGQQQQNQNTSLQ